MKFRFNEDDRTYDLLDDTGEVSETLEEEDFDADYFICDNCGEAYARDWNECIEAYDGSILCTDCAEARDMRRCENCGEWYDACDMHQAWDTDNWFCDRCACDYDHLRYCDGCEHWFEERNVEYCEATDDYRCDDCWVSHNDEIGEYHDFKYQCERGNTPFHKMPDEIEKEFDNPYIGFELETDGGSDAREALDFNSDELDGFFHPEEDGSLSSDGVEWISEPATLPYHMRQMDDYFEFFKVLIRNGYTAHNNGNCGLHMHIDRRYFGDETHQETAAAKLMFIFERHWNDLLRFSRRTDEQCSSWCCNTKYYTPSGYYDKKRRYVAATKANRYKTMIYAPARYRAVNLCNQNTIEIRLWRGSLNPETFEATLKLTHRLAELAKNTPAVKLYSMRFTDVLGDDPVILSYWERVKNRRA